VTLHLAGIAGSMSPLLIAAGLLGAAAVVVALVRWAGARRSVTREGIQNVPGGQERVVEQQDRWSAP